jgi:hypothetical protein
MIKGVMGGGADQLCTPSAAPKCFPNLASFRPIDAECAFSFSKKDEINQMSQGILSPLRPPISATSALVTRSGT